MDGFKFIWRIENFSMLPQSTGEFIDSPTFKINDVESYIRLYPHGKTNKANIRCDLLTECKSTECDTQNCTPVKLSFIYGKKSEYGIWNVVSTELNKCCFYFQRNLIPVIESPQNLFLSANNVDIVCIFENKFLLESLHLITCCKKTTVQIETYTFNPFLRELKIATSGNQKWEYSKTISTEQSNEFQLVLKFRDQCKNILLKLRKVSGISSKVAMCCRYSLTKVDEKLELFCERLLFTATQSEYQWEIPFDIYGREEEKFSNLLCEIIVPTGHITSDSKIGTDLEIPDLSTKKIIPSVLPCNKAHENCHVLLKSMHETKILSDVILQVGADQLSAHKCVLGNISDVFAAMFTNKMKEKETSVVNITDIDKDTVDKMLQFVYGGEVENLEYESSIKLYSAADKYQILELKKLCSFHLKNALKMNTVIKILELGDMHQDDILIKASRSFISANRKQVFNSDVWKSFMKKHLELAADIMLSFCQDS